MELNKRQKRILKNVIQEGIANAYYDMVHYGFRECDIAVVEHYLRKLVI